MCIKILEIRATITIKENSKQAKVVIEMLKTFDFVEIKESKTSKPMNTKAKSKSAIEISLEEGKKENESIFKVKHEFTRKNL